MKRKLGLLAVIVFFGTGWLFRGLLRDTWYEAQQPPLPAAQPYQAPQVLNPKSEPTSNPVSRDNQQAASSSGLPDSVNLAVPFLVQAPKGNWAEPYQDACEEASAIMVDAYYHGRTQKFKPDEGDQAILAVVAFEKKLLGFYEDTNAEETARFIRGYFHDRVLISDLKSADDIKRMLAQGHPVMVPAYGKALGNPNYRGGGPLYHMLVVKGYLKDGRLITNDPGTRLGADYLYQPDVLLRAAHDYNGGDVPHGKSVMIVVLPN